VRERRGDVHPGTLPADSAIFADVASLVVSWILELCQFPRKLPPWLVHRRGVSCPSASCGRSWNHTQTRHSQGDDPEAADHLRALSRSNPIGPAGTICLLSGGCSRFRARCRHTRCNVRLSPLHPSDPSLGSRRGRRADVCRAARRRRVLRGKVHDGIQGLHPPGRGQPDRG
jgi:hypothetical protein